MTGIVEAVSYSQTLLTTVRGIIKRNVKRSTVASVSGSTIRITDGNRQVARLKGAPISPGETVYLLNVTGDDRNPGWLALGAEGGVVSNTPGWRTGLYYGVASSTPITGFGSVIMTANRHYAMPFYSPGLRGIDRVGLEVTTAVAGSTIRLSLYDMDASGSPGSLLYDMGAVSSATTGVKEITIGATLAADTWYCFVIVSNGAPAIRYGIPSTNVIGGTFAGSAQRNAMSHTDRANTTLVSPFGVPGFYDDGFLFLCDVRAT